MAGAGPKLITLVIFGELIKVISVGIVGALPKLITLGIGGNGPKLITGILGNSIDKSAVMELGNSTDIGGTTKEINGFSMLTTRSTANDGMNIEIADKEKSPPIKDKLLNVFNGDKSIHESTNGGGTISVLGKDTEGNIKEGKAGVIGTGTVNGGVGIGVVGSATSSRSIGV